MAGLTPHPRLALLHERFPSEASAIKLSGYVAPSESGSIKLSPSPSSLQEYVEIAQDDVLYSEQHSELGVAELFIDPAAVVSVVSVRRFPLAAAPRRPDEAPGDATRPKSCVNQRIDQCKRDPMVGDARFCDSDEARHLFDILCGVFGPPPK